MISKTRSVVPAGVTRVGVEAAVDYHRPLASPVVWPDWEGDLPGAASFSKQAFYQWRTNPVPAGGDASVGEFVGDQPITELGSSR